ncbi:hypothetical protein KS4_36530 [Poriferisphaera corsica]|uniref:Uncharacterized protein n=1 Tax=Poriferisphaera corsica TaxID=2528020 RepID=A0A517YZA4_9BACT|nr:hypothetical protein [Poriferisphaera corsica]QDU35570.1 hypothetical protein KS4_36530 [Poriferisphaera corsica]
MKNVYVWFEVNTTSENYLSDYKQHALNWAKIGTPIVTGKKNTVVEVITDIMNTTGLKVIPGIKLTEFFRSAFDENPNITCDDPRIWDEIRHVSSQLKQLTNSNDIVFENEGMNTFLYRYYNMSPTEYNDESSENFFNYRDLYNINFDILEGSVATRNWDHNVWLWTGVSGSNDPKYTKSLSTSYAITKSLINGFNHHGNDSSKCRLIKLGKAAYSGSPNSTFSALNDVINKKHDEDALTIIYLDDSTSSQWDLDQVVTAISHAEGDVILYPGSSDIGNHEQVWDAIKNELVRSVD